MEKLFGSTVDEAGLEELEETLLMADVGMQTTSQILQQLRQAASKNKDVDVKAILREELLSALAEDVPLEVQEQQPFVILMVGVNGSGKTTTIGKLAHRFVQEGKSVMVAAGDTFRAGAIEQLKVWADRVGADFISSEPGADPASVMYNALDAAKARGVDVLLCDTAGRLQAHGALMAELGKVMKVMKKKLPDAPHECLLVLDSTIGQNALSQAKGFTEATPLTGVVLTKLDGTAKGGVVLAVKRELGIPVRLIGLGEGADDLRDFNREMFVDALLNVEPSVNKDGE
jgi:fused signal recognition particle receptor